jgi:hypothetical protein
MRNNEIYRLDYGYSCHIAHWLRRKWWVTLARHGQIVNYAEQLESREAALQWARDEVQRREVTHRRQHA